MYRCSSCGSDIDDGFDRCWNCNEAVATTVLGQSDFAPPSSLVATYRVFRDAAAHSDDALAEAASFASGLGRERVLSISNVSDSGLVSVTVWYWSDRPQTRASHVAGFRARERELIILDPG